ncbi:hypothetical protein P8845_21185 [Bacillus spizizenii]|nr:hypothetical protein [Bacillus spizizenii]MCY8168787.1 hypothetical protein [Bacillus spizizenii]MEC0613020.1 hypothetical protein [Bacillus spizizenii]
MKVIVQNSKLLENNQYNLKEALEDVILKYREKSFNISKLNGVIVTGDFFQDVVAFQRKHHQHVTYATNNKNAKAAAKVLNCIENDKNVYYIFLDEQCVKSLISCKIPDIDLAQHIVYHELAHVTDSTQKNNIYSEAEKVGIGVHEIDHYLRYVADELWSEYFAERISTNILISEVYLNELYNLFALNCSNLSMALSKEKENFLQHRNPRTSFETMMPSMHIFLNITSRCFGAIHAIKEQGKVYKIQELLMQVIGDSYFKDIWDLFDEQFIHLYKIYPAEWGSVEILDSLGDIIDKCWKCFGLHQIKFGNQTYFKIDLNGMG